MSRNWLYKKLGLKPIEIVLNDGKVIINHPFHGDNLDTPESIKEFLQEHGSYNIKTGNNKRFVIYSNEVKEVR